MSNDRLKFAIGRLERAATRVERILSETSPAPSSAPADEQLIKRHEALREHVQAVISRIDGLISTGGR